MKVGSRGVAIVVSLALTSIVCGRLLADEMFHVVNSNDFAPRNYSPTESMFQLHPTWDLYAGPAIVGYLGTTSNAVSTPNPNLSPGEIDYLAQTGSSVSTGWAAGFDRTSMWANDKRSRVRGYSVGLMVRDEPVSYSGYVNQTFPPVPGNFVNYNYIYSAKPFDIAMDMSFYPMEIYALRALPYVFIGGGFSVVRLTFNQIPQAAAIGFPPITASETVNMPVALIGAGLKFNPAEHFFLKVQYLYQYRGSVAINNNQFQSGPTIHLNSQSVDFLLGVAFG